MADLDSRMLINGEAVAGNGAPLGSEVAPKEWWYPYSRYTGGEPPHGA